MTKGTLPTRFRPGGAEGGLPKSKGEEERQDDRTDSATARGRLA